MKKKKNSCYSWNIQEMTMFSCDTCTIDSFPPFFFSLSSSFTVHVHMPWAGWPGWPCRKMAIQIWALFGWKDTPKGSAEQAWSGLSSEVWDKTCWPSLNIHSLYHAFFKQAAMLLLKVVKPLPRNLKDESEQHLRLVCPDSQGKIPISPVPNLCPPPQFFFHHD